MVPLRERCQPLLITGDVLAICQLISGHITLVNYLGYLNDSAFLQISLTIGPFKGGLLILIRSTWISNPNLLVALTLPVKVRHIIGIGGNIATVRKVVT